MSGFVVIAIRIAFLAALWLFILFVVNVIRTDTVGRMVSVDEEQANPGKKSRKARRDKRRQAKKSGEPNLLFVAEGKSAGSQVVLHGVISIGRNFDCSLPIDDDYASGSHARIFQDLSGQWIIEDLLSTNGTYVNEVQVSAPTVITANDVVRIGRTQLRMVSSK